MQPPNYQTMTPAEVTTLRDWAVTEGWNPGLADVAVAHAIDPEAFLAIRLDESLAGGGCTMAYGKDYGFMGLYIMRADLRRQGLGAPLWHERLQRLRARLNPEAPIGMAGVLAMKSFYARGGFTWLYDDIRFAGPANGTPLRNARAATAADFHAIERIDRECFPAQRSAFLKSWLTAPGVRVAVCEEYGKVLGFGALRPAEEGFKFGPLFAENADAARALLSHLMSEIPGAPVQLDIPEANSGGLTLAQEFGLSEVFRCARMVFGKPPNISVERIFGLTSLEFG